MRPGYISSMNDSPRSKASTIFGNAFANQVNNSPLRELGSLIQTIDGPFRCKILRKAKSSSFDTITAPAPSA